MSSDLRYSRSIRSASSGTRGRCRRAALMSAAAAARAQRSGLGSARRAGRPSEMRIMQRGAQCSPDLPYVYQRSTKPTPPTTDLDALLRRECNRHTYSRLVPINASTTKAACDGECGRIWQQMQWVRHARAEGLASRLERDSATQCRELHSSSLLPYRRVLSGRDRAPDLSRARLYWRSSHPILLSFLT